MNPLLVTVLGSVGSFLLAVAMLMLAVHVSDRRGKSRGGGR